MPDSLEGDVIVRRHVVSEGVWHARALVLKVDHLRDRLAALLNGVHPGGLHVVLGTAVPTVPRRILGDLLLCRLDGSKKLLGELPLKPKCLPPLVEGDVRLLALHGHTAVVEDDVDVVLGLLRPGVDGVPLLACRREVGQCGLAQTLWWRR